MPRTSFKKNARTPKALPKCPTGIKGLDEVTQGGIPKDRTTLVCGGAGSGKTLLGLDFVVKGVTEHAENGVFMSFEETPEELFDDVGSLNLDLKPIVAQKKIVIDHVVLHRDEIQTEGEFNLDGIFVRLEHAIDSIGAKRVVIDSIESLFAGVRDPGVLRLEVKKLFRWLKTKHVTSIVTGEPGADKFTRHGLEENISDCIILLDNRVKDQVAIRRLRVVKYRGSRHGTNEFPFVISDDGLSVIPITSATLDQPASGQRLSTGIPSLDALFTGGGYAKGSTILASGTAGTGKTSLAAAFAIATCKRGERCLFVSYEESADQLVQNMKSIGLDLRKWMSKDLLRLVSTRPGTLGLENHLLELHKALDDFKPDSVVIDPLTSLIGQGDPNELQSMTTRMIDVLKRRRVTSFFTSLVGSSALNDTSGEIGVSSLIDTWIVVREIETSQGRKRLRGLYIVKSRGMNHSSDVHKLVLSDKGVSVEEMPEDPEIVLDRRTRSTPGAASKSRKGGA
ncbi:MAG: circadian clock protein KaiC [Thermoplasmata archaeon]|jgi:circadian clock protein KaiC|nr:circadian clock protein KaiC [Thermoplasmata archaeon]